MIIKQEEKIMPTILFDDGFTQKEKTILTKTFKSNCKHLGITERDCTVAVRRANIGPKNHLGSMGCLTSDYFMVVLNANGFNLFEGISVLGHETTHIAQYLRGDLSDVQEQEGGCNWCGQYFPKFICTSDVAYKDLPWEREAFELQPKLHKHSIDALERHEVGYVLDVSRFAFEER